MRLDAPPYAAHPPARLSAPAATARAAGTHFKTGLAKQRPRLVPARVQARFITSQGRRALEQIHTFPT